MNILLLPNIDLTARGALSQMITAIHFVVVRGFLNACVIPSHQLRGAHREGGLAGGQRHVTLGGEERWARSMRVRLARCCDVSSNHAAACANLSPADAQKYSFAKGNDELSLNAM